ncbi:MAG: hypothetical protein KF760_11700 [Candidatus Eremiobacteraeota bacterium]|nr:hypothetical protein [Candidatus Eremiobacteraeota bacterium]MCW5868654.1 hypothetical protein [Candidatus Eremiobacteraeota bacterium]
MQVCGLCSQSKNEVFDSRVVFRKDNSSANVVGGLMALGLGIGFTVKGGEEEFEFNGPLCQNCRDGVRPSFPLMARRCLGLAFLFACFLGLIWMIHWDVELLGCLGFLFGTPLAIFWAVHSTYKCPPGFRVHHTNWDGTIQTHLLLTFLVAVLMVGAFYLKQSLASPLPAPSPTATPDAYSSLPRVVLVKFQQVDQAIAKGDYRLAAQLAESLIGQLKLLKAGREPRIRAHRGAALAFTKLNQKSQAKAHYKSLMSLDPSHAAEYKKAGF